MKWALQSPFRDIAFVLVVPGQVYRCHASRAEGVGDRVRAAERGVELVEGSGHPDNVSCAIRVR
jgi:hypothetical protein